MTFHDLSQLDEQNNNRLMSAIINQSNGVEAMLQEVAEFTPQEKVALLARENKSGLNALMIAVTYNVNALKGVLKILGQCERVDRERILLVSLNDKGSNVLTSSKADVAARNHYLQVLEKNLPGQWKKTYIQTKIELQLQLFANKMDTFSFFDRTAAQYQHASLINAWESYKENPADPDLTTAFAKAIENAKPLFNEVDDNNELINLLVRAFKNFVSIFINVDWQEETYDNMQKLATEFHDAPYHILEKAPRGHVIVPQKTVAPAAAAPADIEDEQLMAAIAASLNEPVPQVVVVRPALGPENSPGFYKPSTPIPPDAPKPSAPRL